MAQENMEDWDQSPMVSMETIKVVYKYMKKKKILDSPKGVETYEIVANFIGWPVIIIQFLFIFFLIYYICNILNILKKRQILLLIQSQEIIYNPLSLILYISCLLRKKLKPCPLDTSDSPPN
jgi:hypothetical protein